MTNNESDKTDRNVAILAIFLIILLLGMFLEWGIVASVMGFITFLIGLLGDSYLKFNDQQPNS